MEFMKDPHTALFVGPTGAGKTHLALNFLETEYRECYDFIVIICPTLRYNQTYRGRRWFWKDPYVILVEPKDQLYEWIQALGEILAGCKTLFMVDDIIADKNLDKKRQPLLELAISGRHRDHSLWLFTQSYTAIPLNLRRQLKMIYVWYQKDRRDFNLINEENEVIETQDELTGIKRRLKVDKHACLIIRVEPPSCWTII